MFVSSSESGSISIWSREGNDLKTTQTLRNHHAQVSGLASISFNDYTIIISLSLDQTLNFYKFTDSKLEFISFRKTHVSDPTSLSTQLESKILKILIVGQGIEIKFIDLEKLLDIQIQS